MESRPAASLPTPTTIRADEIKKNRMLFWAGIALIGVIAIILVIVVMGVMNHPDGH